MPRKRKDTRTLMTETITVVGVEAPSKDNQPFQITLGDGRKVATWNEDIAAEAMRLDDDEEAEALIGTKSTPRGTNHYLNSLNGIRDKRKPAASGSGGSGSAPARGQDPTIGNQWAIGRALELLRDSGEEFAFPLDEATTTKVRQTAETLVALRDTLKS